MTSRLAKVWRRQYQVKSRTPASFTAGSNQCLYPQSRSPCMVTKTQPSGLGRLFSCSNAAKAWLFSGTCRALRFLLLGIDTSRRSRSTQSQVSPSAPHVANVEKMLETFRRVNSAVATLLLVAGYCAESGAGAKEHNRAKAGKSCLLFRNKQ
jgi:hypothetical protein